ncbi:MAG: VCBS repeat-containing protein [Myxococcota bacterium]
MARLAVLTPVVAAAWLGVAPARASPPVFDGRVENPFVTIDVGLGASPAAADLDGDGDVDLLVGDHSGGLRYFENTGTALAATFTEATGSGNPLAGQSGGAVPRPAFADVDADGDLDLIVGRDPGTLAYFENTGDAVTPVFAERTGASNPFDGFDVGNGSSPAPGDLDRDGDLDVGIAERTGGFAFLENTGPASAPSFVERTGAANPFHGIQAGPNGAAALLDADQDGDLDLAVGASALGSASGSIDYFENQGDGASPQFVLLPDEANPFSWLRPGGLPTPTPADLDSDGDPDLLWGSLAGTLATAQNRRGQFTELPATNDPTVTLGWRFGGAHTLGDFDTDGDIDLVSERPTQSLSSRYFENVGTPTAPEYRERTGAANPVDGITSSAFSTSSAADVDGDGDLDLVQAAQADVRYFENIGTVAAPSYVERTGTENPFVVLLGGHPATFGDLDGDGDLDVLTGWGSPTLKYFENTGTVASGSWVERTGAANPFDEIGVVFYAAPAFGDLDGDGDLDVASAQKSFGPALYLENVGTTASPRFVERVGDENPLDDTRMSFSTVTLGDLDGDGDLDFLEGSQAGTSFVDFFENPGVRAQQPAIELTGALDPLGGVSLPGGDPVLADFDADGDRDAVIGQSDGTLAYFENTRDALAPLFTERTGPANPFDGIDVGSDAAPALLDLEGDGDPDVVVGAADGTLATLENNGSAGAPAFTLLTGTNPLAAFDVGDAARVSIGDLDADGDPDVVAGNSTGSLRYFENTGSRIAPSFTENTGAANPFDTIGTASASAPALADLEGDGDLDLTLGAADGTLAVYRNDGTAIAPSFVEQVGNRSLFDGIDVGDDAQPGLGDFDGDGDPDVLVGEATGDVRVFRLPEPGRRGLLASGLALLLGLAKLRRR